MHKEDKDQFIEQLDQIMTLMKRHKVDLVEFENVKIVKNYHEPSQDSNELTDEELLYYVSE